MKMIIIVLIVTVIKIYRKKKILYLGEEELFKIKFKHLVESFENNLLKFGDKTSDNENIKNEEQKFNPTGFEKQKFNQVQYENYDEFEDNEDNDNSTKCKTIPPIISKIWGRISEEKYQKLKKNSSWLDLTTKVCTECYLNFTRMYFLIYKIFYFYYC